MKTTISDIISKTSIDGDVLDNEQDQLGNKIKLRSSSYTNLLLHVVNIPYHAQNVSSNNLSKANNEGNLNILSTYPTSMLNGTGSKPINVKPYMFDNIYIKGSIDKIDETIKEDNISPEVKTNETSIEETNNVEIDSNDKFVEINNARQLLEAAKEEADIAEQDAKKSDEELSQLSIEQTEMEKKLEETKRRKTEILKQLNNAFENQSTILLSARKKYENIAREAKIRKENNENRIIEFRNNIDNTVKLITKEEEEIAKNQELLNALGLIDQNIQINSPNNDYQENYEYEAYRKIA